MAAQYGQVSGSASGTGVADMCDTAGIADPARLEREVPTGPVVPTGAAVAVPDRLGGLIAGLAVAAALVLTDLLLGAGPQVNGLFTTPPFVTAVFSGARRTAVVGVVSIGANVVVGNFGADYTSAQGFRTGGVVVASIGAVLLSMLREREQRHVLTLSRIAEVAQLAVLRNLPSRIGPAELAVRYVSATAQAHVGGDFYEALPCRAGMRAIVGDVRGKGLEAVQLANVLVGAFRGADHDEVPLTEVARSLDQAFLRFEPGEEDFATVVLIELRTDGRLTVANCGHPLPLIVRDGGTTPVVPPAYVPPVGLHPQPRPSEVQLVPGDRVLLFTDGILESRHAGRFFDFEANLGVVAIGPPDEALAALVDRLVTFTGGLVGDDVALLLAEYR